MSVTVVVGGQYGSEGKGKTVAHLASEFSLAVRTGGPNSGHTVEKAGKFYKLRSIPSAFVNPLCRLAIGAGGIIDVKVLLDEIKVCAVDETRIMVDPQAVIVESHYGDLEDSIKKTIGSTGVGVGVAVAEKIGRQNAVLAQDIPELSQYIGDVAGYANNICDEKRGVVIEGSQGFLLSLHHGLYPYVTSRDVTAGSICGEVGIGPKRVDQIILVIRTYPIRVAGNSGPLPEEINWETVTEESGSSKAIKEMTTVTKRLRRIGRFNLESIKRAALVNSATQIALNFVDYIDYQNRGATLFEVLTPRAKSFVYRIEEELRVPVTLIGTGPSDNDIIDLRDQKLNRKEYQL